MTASLKLCPREPGFKAGTGRCAPVKAGSGVPLLLPPRAVEVHSSLVGKQHRPFSGMRTPRCPRHFSPSGCQQGSLRQQGDPCSPLDAPSLPAPAQPESSPQFPAEGAGEVGCPYRSFQDWQTPPSNRSRRPRPLRVFIGRSAVRAELRGPPAERGALPPERGVDVGVRVF